MFLDCWLFFRSFLRLRPTTGKQDSAPGGREEAISAGECALEFPAVEWLTSSEKDDSADVLYNNEADGLHVYTTVV